ncbi:MAG: response regulator [Pleurocapsa minor GSE-CHR-MK-17-07R]|jgi:PAS domain S-box-containing protein|nr:response regulator [Pleurocapsa minor GSE-CHR-MK 17-07R]
MEMTEQLWLPDSHEDWRVLLGNITTVITLLDEQFAVISQFNAEHTPLSVAIGQPFSQCMAQIPHLMHDTLQRMRDLNQPQVLETLHPGDKPKLYRHEMRTVKLTHDQTVIAVYSTEIAESSKQANRMFVHSTNTDDLFRRLVDIMPAIVIWIDANETYLYVNKYVANRTGIPQEEFVGRKITEITRTESSLEQWRGQMADVARARQPITVEYTYTWKGAVGHNLITVVPVFDAQGTITSFFSHSVELAKIFEREEALKRANIQAEHAMQAKDRFIANVSHELRTPLNVILGFAGLLRDDVGQTGQAHDYLDHILNSGHYLSRLVNDMLDASRIDVGQFTLELSSVDLHRLLRRITQAQAEFARAKGLKFAVEVKPDTMIWLIADETRLRQIINNLVQNAIKFTDSGDVQLRVNYVVDRQSLQIEVLDTGIGIPEAHVEDIFEAFVTLGISSKKDGIGLGLYITRLLVQLMGGTIVAGNRTGGGAVFRVEIPLQQVAPETHGPTLGSGLLPLRISEEPGQYRAMIVEDTTANAALFAERLTRWGFAVDLVQDGSYALERIRAWQPHVILLDLYLPGVDGFTLAEQVRADAQLRDIPVIVLTASAISPELERTRLNGMAAILTKPISFDALAQAIATCLNVEFIYETTAPVSDDALSGLKPALTVDHIQHLPEAWLQQMYFAAATASPDETASLIEALESDAYETAAKLRDLTAAFNFSTIADLIETVLNVNSLT